MLMLDDLKNTKFATSFSWIDKENSCIKIMTTRASNIFGLNLLGKDKDSIQVDIATWDYKGSFLNKPQWFIGKLEPIKISTQEQLDTLIGDKEIFDNLKKAMGAYVKTEK